MLPLKTAVSMPPPPVSVSWPDPPWIVSAKTEPMTSSLPLSASIREMATSRVALKSRKLLVAVPATMLLPPRPSIDRLADRQPAHVDPVVRSEEHASELQSLMRISYAGFCLKKKNNSNHTPYINSNP